MTTRFTVRYLLQFSIQKIYIWATWGTFLPQAQKIKRNQHDKKFYIFPKAKISYISEGNIPSPKTNITNPAKLFYIFSKVLSTFQMTADQAVK